MREAVPPLVLVGPFPPPVHGMALVNERVASRLKSRGAKPIVVDIGGRRLRLEWWSRARRGWAVATAFARFMRLMLARPRGTVYLSLSGGLGQAYDAGFLLAARLRGARVIVHHHSSHYTSRRRWLTSLALWSAGRAGVHVVLCLDHGRRLQQMYPQVHRVRVVSNAAFFGETSQDIARPPRDQLRTIGFLGNVCRDKGIDQFLEVARTLTTQARGAFRFVIAGPFMDSAGERLLRQFVSECDDARYLGPLYGAEKQGFFDELDVLLFPSRYRDETEPLTVYEALEAGAPVIALDRGCIRSQIQDGAGLVVDRREVFVAEAVRQIRAWHAAPEEFRRASIAARARCLSLARTAAGALEQLVAEIAAGEDSGDPQHPASAR